MWGKTSDEWAINLEIIGADITHAFTIGILYTYNIIALQRTYHFRCICVVEADWSFINYFILKKQSYFNYEYVNIMTQLHNYAI